MNIFSSHISLWILVPLVFLIWVLVLSTIKRIVFSIIRKIADKTVNRIDDIVLGALELPVHLIVYASGIVVVQHMLPRVEGVDLLQYLLQGFKAVCIAAGIIFVDRLLQGLIGEASARIEILKASNGVVRGFVRVVVVCLGVLIILDSFGISVTPILASLGIGSLAVALALQPTLENFFSGIQLIIDKPIQIGDMIKLESGEEGKVDRIGWRSTWVVMSNNNTVVMPNKMLVNTRVINYHYPDNEIVFTVPVGVHYSSDLDRVERVVLSVAREVLRDVPGGVKGFEPLVRFTELGDFSINLNVVLRSQDMGSSHLVRHELIKRLQKRFQQEQIIIPFPTRTLIEEKA